MGNKTRTKAAAIENENVGIDFFKANKLTDGKNKKLQNRLQSVVGNFINHFDRHYFPKYIKAYKNYNQNNKDREAMLFELGQEWRSNVKTPFVKVRVDALFSSLYTSNFELTTKARKESYVEKQKVYQAYLDRCFGNRENKKAVVDGIKEAINIGNGFFKIGFKVLKETVEYIKAGKKNTETYELDETAAIMEFVSPFDIFYEEDGLPFYEKRKVIYRKWMPIDAAIEKYSSLFKISKEEKETILRRPYRFSNKDYTKYKLLTYYDESEVDSDKGSEGDKFDLSYFDNSYIEVVEYWEPKNLVVAFNGWITYDGVNPNPFNNHPFLQIGFQTTPGYTTGVGVGISQDGLQMSYDLIFNAYLDSVKLSVAPMFRADKGFFIDGEEQTLNYIPYKILTSRGDNKEFKRIDIVVPDPNAQPALQSIANLGDLEAGTNRYNMGGSGIERSATGATIQQAIAKDKLNPLVESINNDLFTKAAEYFSLLGIKYLPGKIKVRITGADNVDKFEEIVKDDLMGRFDVYFNVETFKNVAKELEKQQNLEALQIINTAGIDPVSQRYLLKQEDVIKKSVDLFDFGSDSILSKDEFYERTVDEELSKLRAKKDIHDKAAEEGLFQQDQFQQPGGGGFQQGGGGGFQSQGKPPMEVSGAPSNPETFEQKIEGANTKSVDMRNILAKLGR